MEDEKTFSKQINLECIDTDSFELGVNMIRETEEKELEPDITILVYFILNNVCLNNWKIESSPSIFRPKKFLLY